MITRRAFVRGLGGVLLMGAPPVPAPSADDLYGHSRLLAARLNDTPPSDAVHHAAAHLDGIEAMLALSLTAAPGLHRAAALAALVAAAAARWAVSADAPMLANRAERHARVAGDGPLQAQALFLRAKLAGETGYAGDAGSREGEALLTAALWASGTGRGEALLRALLRYEVAWELAALGHEHDAYTELAIAELELARTTTWPDLAVAPPAAAHDVRWAIGHRAAVLRRLGLPAPALAACEEATTGAARGSSSVLVDAARCHLAQGAPDAAAAALLDAARLNASAGLVQRQRRVAAVAGSLPGGVASAELTELVAGVG